MPAASAQRARVLDEENNLLETTCSGLEIKSEHGKDYVEGYVATKGVDKKNDLFTEGALKGMAERLQEQVDTVDVHFPSFTEDDLRAAAENVTNNGNVDHNNSPVGLFGDPRVVPAFRIMEAKYDGFGVKIRAVLNTDGLLPEQQDAVKNAIREKYLNAFSIEYVATKVKYVEKDGEKIRLIGEAEPKGAALTGRPVQNRARVTDTDLKAEVKSVLDDVEQKAEYMFEVGDEVSWSDTSGTVRDRTKDSCFNSEIDGDVEVCGSEEEPAYLIEVDNDDGTMVGHKQGTLSMKSGHEMKAENYKSAAGVRFRGTKDGELDESAIDKEENTLSDHYLFGEGEDKEDFSYPVVDADGYLRRDNVEAAKSLGARGGVDASELERKLKTLNDEFDNPPLTFKEGEKNILGDNMPDEEDDGDGQPDGEPDEGAEEKSELQSTVEELKSTVEEVKSQNEELKESNEEIREENEELKSELEDYQEIEELKSDIGSIEEELKSLTAEDEPVTDPNEKKNQKENQTPVELKSASAGFIEKNSEVLAEKHNMSEEEVLDYAE